MQLDDEIYTDDYDQTLTKIAKIFGYNLPGVYEGDRKITNGGYNSEKTHVKRQDYSTTKEWKQDEHANNDYDDKNDVEWKPDDFDANKNYENNWNSKNNNFDNTW